MYTDKIFPFHKTLSFMFIFVKFSWVHDFLYKKLSLFMYGSPNYMCNYMCKTLSKKIKNGFQSYLIVHLSIRHKWYFCKKCYYSAIDILMLLSAWLMDFPFSICFSRTTGLILTKPGLLYSVIKDMYLKFVK